MMGLLLKIIIFPIGLIVSNYIFRLDYTLSQALIVSLVLIVADQLMELLILREGTLWVSTILDSVAAFAIIYFSQLYLPGVNISFWAAFGATLLIAVIEYLQHSYLIRSRRVKTEEDMTDR